MRAWQVLDASARESIPSIVRWFQTVLHQPKFASVLGPVTLASAQLKAPKAAKKKGSDAGAKPKDSKKPAKENKPKQAPKKAVANGPAVGVPYNQHSLAFGIWHISRPVWEEGHGIAILYHFFDC